MSLTLNQRDIMWVWQQYGCSKICKLIFSPTTCHATGGFSWELGSFLYDNSLLGWFFIPPKVVPLGLPATGGFFQSVFFQSVPCSRKLIFSSCNSGRSSRTTCPWWWTPTRTSPRPCSSPWTGWPTSQWRGWQWNKNISVQYTILNVLNKTE